MTTLPAGWAFNGSATWTAGAGVLTPAATGQAGTIVYANPLVVAGVFKVGFEVQLGNGDGAGLMIETTSATAVGVSGGGLGMDGLGGLAVELDTYQNGCDADADHVGVDSLSIDCAAESGTLASLTAAPLGSFGINLHDGQWHQVYAIMNAWTLTVLVDGATALSNVPVPPIPAGTPLWFGFGGGTGAAVAVQQIRNVTIAFPTPQCM